MDLKDLLKSTEGLIVIIGCLVTFFFGKLFALITLAAYVVLNIPNAYAKVMEWYNDFKGKL